LLTCTAFGQAVWTFRPQLDNSATKNLAGKPGTYLISADVLEEGGIAFYLRSRDGIAWEKVGLPYSNALACYNGRFVGCDGYNVWKSDDGLSASMVFSSWLYLRSQGIAYGNGIWLIALEDGTVLRSDDNADTWTRHPTLAVDFNSMAFGGGTFLLTARDGSLTSPDGLIWTIGPVVPGGSLCYESGRFQTATHFSMDAMTWNLLPDAALLPIGCNVLRAGGGKFFTWSEGIVPPQFYTTSGLEWGVPVALPVELPVLDGVADAAFCGDLWIAVTNTGKILTSNVTGNPLPTIPETLVSPAIHLTWPSELGRIYVLENSPDQSTWAPLTGEMSGTGIPVDWVAPAPLMGNFFRVRVR
jgi:hypothetical protein